jgi:hypothetical protein
MESGVHAEPCDAKRRNEKRRDMPPNPATDIAGSGRRV